MSSPSRHSSLPLSEFSQRPCNLTFHRARPQSAPLIILQRRNWSLLTIPKPETTRDSWNRKTSKTRGSLALHLTIHEVHATLFHILESQGRACGERCVCPKGRCSVTISVASCVESRVSLNVAVSTAFSPPWNQWCFSWFVFFIYCKVAGGSGRRVREGPKCRLRFVDVLGFLVLNHQCSMQRNRLCERVEKRNERLKHSRKRCGNDVETSDSNVSSEKQFAVRSL